jgi:hypothetical protein
MQIRVRTAHLLESRDVILRWIRVAALEGGGLCVADGVLDRAFAIWITYTGGVTHNIVVLECSCVDRVEFGLASA